MPPLHMPPITELPPLMLTLMLSFFLFTFIISLSAFRCRLFSFVFADAFLSCRWCWCRRFRHYFFFISSSLARLSFAAFFRRWWCRFAFDIFASLRHAELFSMLSDFHLLLSSALYYLLMLSMPLYYAVSPPDDTDAALPIPDAAWYFLISLAHILLADADYFDIFSFFASISFDAFFFFDYFLSCRWFLFSLIIDFAIAWYASFATLSALPPYYYFRHAACRFTFIDAISPCWFSPLWYCFTPPLAIFRCRYADFFHYAAYAISFSPYAARHWYQIIYWLSFMFISTISAAHWYFISHFCRFARRLSFHYADAAIIFSPYFMMLSILFGFQIFIAYFGFLFFDAWYAYSPSSSFIDFRRYFFRRYFIFELSGFTPPDFFAIRMPLMSAAARRFRCWLFRHIDGLLIFSIDYITLPLIAIAARLITSPMLSLAVALLMPPLSPPSSPSSAFAALPCYYSWLMIRHCRCFHGWLICFATLSFAAFRLFRRWAADTPLGYAGCWCHCHAAAMLPRGRCLALPPWCHFQLRWCFRIKAAAFFRCAADAASLSFLPPCRRLFAAICFIAIIDDITLFHCFSILLSLIFAAFAMMLMAFRRHDAASPYYAWYAASSSLFFFFFFFAYFFFRFDIIFADVFLLRFSLFSMPLRHVTLHYHFWYFFIFSFLLRWCYAADAAAPSLIAIMLLIRVSMLAKLSCHYYLPLLMPEMIRLAPLRCHYYASSIIFFAIYHFFFSCQSFSITFADIFELLLIFRWFRCHYFRIISPLRRCRFLSSRCRHFRFCQLRWSCHFRRAMPAYFCIIFAYCLRYAAWFDSRWWWWCFHWCRFSAISLFSFDITPLLLLMLIFLSSCWYFLLFLRYFFDFDYYISCFSPFRFH